MLNEAVHIVTIVLYCFKCIKYPYVNQLVVITKLFVKDVSIRNANERT